MDELGGMVGSVQCQVWGTVCPQLVQLRRIHPVQCNQHYLGLWFKLSLQGGFAPRFFCKRRGQEGLSSPNGGPLLPERESAVPLDLLSFSYSHQRQQNLAQKGEPRGNFLFMPKVDLIEVKWAK